MRLSSNNNSQYYNKLKAVKRHIKLLKNELSTLLNNDQTPQSLKNALTKCEENNEVAKNTLKATYPDTREDHGGVGTKGDYIELWVSVPSNIFEAGSAILSLMLNTYQKARELINEQKTIEENNRRNPSRAFFPRHPIKLQLTKPQPTEIRPQSPSEFKQLKLAISKKWTKLKEGMDKLYDIENTMEFKQSETCLKNLYAKFAVTKNLFDLNKIFEPFYSIELETLGSFNHDTEYLKLRLLNFFNFIKENILRQPTYATDVFEESIKQFPTIISEVNNNLQALEKTWVLSIDYKTQKLYRHFIDQLKKEIINNLVYYSNNCPTTLNDEKITPIQALDHLNLLCSDYREDQTTINLLISVLNIIAQLAAYYPKTIQPTLLSLAHSVFESVDSYIKAHLEAPRIHDSFNLLPDVKTDQDQNVKKNVPEDIPPNVTNSLINRGITQEFNPQSSAVQIVESKDENLETRGVHSIT